MAAKRLEMHQLQELVRLHRKGNKVREVARLLGISPNTERVYRQALAAAGLLDGDADELPELRQLRDAIQQYLPRSPQTPSQEVSSVAQWTEDVESLMDKRLGPKAIHTRLAERHGESYKGSYWAIRRLVKSIRKSRGIQAEDVAIPVETSPGDVAQVDFGYAGRLIDPTTGTLRRAWVFVMVLGYSRHMYARVVFDQRVTTWLWLHIQAFEFFGGVPATVVPDNLKSAVIRAAFGPGQDTSLNRSYRELARHYGFQIDPTPPYQPRKKGKVEAGVKYVKRSFLVGRDGETAAAVNEKLQSWVLDVAGRRIHGTTRKRPIEVFVEEEKACLSSLPASPYTPVEWKPCTVHRDAHVAFDKRLYSVPWDRIGETAWLRATPSSVVIYINDERVATHERHGYTLRSTLPQHLPEHRRDYRHRSPAYWEDRAENMGASVLGLVNDIFESDDVLSQLNCVQAVVTLLETLPLQRAAMVAERARFYGSYRYRDIKSIVEKKLDSESLPHMTPIEGVTVPRPRFARDMRALLDAALEVTDEPH